MRRYIEHQMQDDVTALRIARGWFLTRQGRHVGTVEDKRPVWPAFVLGVAVGVLAASIAVVISRLPM